MANIQVKNTATGQVLSIPEDQVPYMSAQWKVVKAAPVAPTIPAPQMQNAAPARTGTTGTPITIYKQGSSMQIMPSDLGYWQGQGWSQTAGTPSATNQPSTTQPAVSSASTGASTGDQTTLPAGYSYNPSLPAGYVQGPNNSIVPISSLASSNTIADVVAETAGADATEEEILAALDKLKAGTIDPYYNQVIDQYKQQVAQEVSRKAEDRVKQLDIERFNALKNVENTKKSLEASGMTFTGQGIQQLGAASAYPASPSAEVPKMTPEQMGLEGDVNYANRVVAESSQQTYARNQQDLAAAALARLGSANMGGLNFPTTSPTGQNIVGDIEYQRRNAILSGYGNIANQKGALTDYQKLFY